MIAPSAQMMSLGVSHTGKRLRKLRFLMTDNNRRGSAQTSDLFQSRK
jgi:hypothetical protein